MSRITHACSECGKLAHEVSKTPVLFAPNFENIILACGHKYFSEKPKVFSCPDFSFSDNTKPYPFQKENIELVVRSGFRAGIFDEMGLGKTVSALGILRLADLGIISSDSTYPVAILVKAGLRHQWLKEVYTKLGRIALLCDSEPSEVLFKLCNIHIYSQDGLRNNENRGSLPYKTIIIDECQQIKNPESKRTKAIIDLIASRTVRKDNKDPLRRKRIEMIARDLLTYHGLNTRFELFFSELDRNKLGLTEISHDIKDGIIRGKITISRFHAENDLEEEVIGVILHEIAHAITPGAGHSALWSECAKSIGGDGKQFVHCQGTIDTTNTVESVRNIITLSGTPIKNHAGEFFPVLNILRPEKFPSYNGFLRYWTRTYFGTRGKAAKLGGLNNPEKFGEYTKDFLIRHERKDVLPDLPAIQRNFIVNVLAENLEDSYSDELKEFIKKYEESKEGSEVSNVLAVMARMRHIVGLSKTSDAVEWVNEFLESHNGEIPKLTIFHHHNDVGKILFVGLSRLCRELEIPGPVWLSEEGISDEERQKRVNEFVSGEKQLLIASTLRSGEGLNLQVCHHCLIVERQWNPANEEQAEGRFSRIGSTADKIGANYLICAGSIDEMFSEIVERKRQYIGESNAALMGKDVGQVTKFDETSVMKELAEKLFTMGRKKFSIQSVVA